MILGFDYFFSIFLPGQITCSQSSLIAQNSIFGFLVSGKLTELLNSNSMLNLHIIETNIDNQLQDFWPKAESNFDEASDGIKAEEKSDSIFNLFTHTSNDDAQPNLKEDDIVLIKDEGPPGIWPMARVLQVLPGNDGLVPNATVKTKDSVFKRPVHKLHKLPIYPN
ncbi:hypothetical protein TNIN_376611 [Trichonephila inaurata madagascariensis]|uniref:DUF5641 domain-containing protein n=1 Tax=Trichonephila inaurata madagascariensis TaxID=2747483 RepID=A0A8X7CI96_9ARAC|nr:hypothetical protein TNIN_376611 [Trichonephila inaurata madagascariensis]